MLLKLLKSKRWEYLVLAGLLIVGFWIGVNRVPYGVLINWPDDFFWGNRWERVLSGQLPYRDFHEQYGVGFFLALAPVYKLLGGGLPAIRVIQYCLFPVVVVTLAWLIITALGLRGWRRWAAYLLVMFVFSGWSWLTTPIRVWMGMAALLPTWYGFKRRSLNWVFGGGSTTVLVGLFSTEQGVFTLVAGLVGILFWIFWQGGEKRFGLRALLLYGAGFGVNALAMAILMAGTGVLEPYIKIAFVQMPTLQNAAHGMIFPDFVWGHPLSLVWYMPFVLLAAEAVFWVKRAFKKPEVNILVPMILVYALFSLRVYMGRTEGGHLAADGTPIWVVLAVSWFGWLANRLRKLAMRLEFLATGLMFSFLIFSSSYFMYRVNPSWSEIIKRSLFPSHALDQLVYSPWAKVWLYPQEAENIGNVLGYLASQGVTSEAVYPFPIASGFSLMMGGTVPSYYDQAWFAEAAEKQRGLITDIEKRQIPWVIYSRRDYVMQTARMGEVYILNTYQPVVQFGDYVVMKRAKKWDERELEDFLLAGGKFGEISGTRDVRKGAGNRWEITGEKPEWEATSESGGSDGKDRTLVLRYRLGFFPGAATLSKTALTVYWNEPDGSENNAVLTPFLYPPLASQWQESWLELPKEISPQKLWLSLSWPGGLNPRANWVEWGEIRLR
jgi:hypothetical protein